MDCQTAIRHEGHLFKTVTYILSYVMENFFQKRWKYLGVFSKNILNIFDFCLAEGAYVEQTFTVCLVGIYTLLESLQSY